MVILHTTNEQKNEHILDYFDKKGIKHKAKALQTGDYTFMIEACLVACEALDRCIELDK